MTRDETIALFERCEAARGKALAEGKSADDAHEAAKAIWNAWAEGVLAERKRLEEAGEQLPERSLSTSLPEWFVRLSPAMQAWIEVAKTNFSAVRFMTGAPVGALKPSSLSAENSSNEALSIREVVCKTERINFRGFIFPGQAVFGNAQFLSDALFEDVCFFGDAGFGHVEFSEIAVFDRARFDGFAGFQSAKFIQGAQFDNVRFSRDTVFSNVEFSGKGWFAGGRFETAFFAKDAQFENAGFGGDARFNGSQFFGYAIFNGARFSEKAKFKKVRFSGSARFYRTQFSDEVQFVSTQFSGDVGFDDAEFSGGTSFLQATFDDYTTFRKARFLKEADFTAIEVKRAFDLAGAHFERLPSVIQAHFTQAPRLDNATLGKDVEPGGFWRALFTRCDEDVSARYRELKRIALESHNHDLEHQYFRGELRAIRSAFLRPWQAQFWWSLAYDALSDFGRSTLRPFLLWLLSIPAVAVTYLAVADKLCPDAFGRALYLALSSAVVIGSNRLTGLGQAYACLYGGSTSDPLVSSLVATVGIVHALISAALIFLFLLALRNLFKVK